MTEKMTTMTISELEKLGSQKLRASGKENSDFDARCLLEFVLNLNPTQYLLNRSEEVDSVCAEKFLSLVERRSNGEPLQYILGKWEFMGLPFYVGEGVLIPRPETEMLVEYALDFLKDKKNSVVIDLCSGSGCIAISVAKHLPNAKVYAVEKSDLAFPYLKKNIWLNCVFNVSAVHGDIFDRTLLSDIKPDLILSNPPYIRSPEIASLQSEVRNEPSMALDGGEDGLVFYREIANGWLDRLGTGGAIAVECAEDQTEDIIRMFSEKTQYAEAFNDLSGLPRTVTAIK
ncbi:MAG: peptide chain release factor N(5)-glutamine methyltransferase [Clostridiaceae bacterium]|nr:peptide chain release factor N(5)-glutamine methyltransferase [Clostridiaceae bacterium]MDY5890106.1 peptide chain release factor N(5)-glutamine methyltransferase [Oscillospiraceae bacterium]